MYIYIWEIKSRRDRQSDKIDIYVYIWEIKSRRDRQSDKIERDILNGGKFK